MIIIIIFALIQPRQTAQPTTQCHIDPSVTQESYTSRPRLPRRAANGEAIINVKIKKIVLNKCIICYD